MKRVLGFVLAVAMLAALISVPVFADTPASGYTPVAITFDDQTVGEAPDIEGLTIEADDSAAVTVEDAPADPSLEQFAANADSPAEYEKLDLGNALKITGTGEVKITLDAGILPAYFNTAYTSYSADNSDNITTQISDGTTAKTISVRNGSSLYILPERYPMTGQGRLYMFQPRLGQWLPVEMGFDTDGQSDSEPAVEWSVYGRLRIPLSPGSDYAAGFPDYTENGNIKLGDYFDGLDLTKPAKIIYTINLGAAEHTVYLDNLMLYDRSYDVTGGHYFYDFEDQTAGAAVTSKNWRTPYQWVEANHTDAAGVQQWYASIAFDNRIAVDPTDSENLVLRAQRGFGRNITDHEGGVKLLVKKPSDYLSVRYRLYYGFDIVPNPASVRYPMMAVSFSAGKHEDTNGAIPSTGQAIGGVTAAYTEATGPTNSLQGGAGRNLYPAVSGQPGTWYDIRVDYDLEKGIYYNYVNGQYWSVTNANQNDTGLANLLTSSDSDMATLQFAITNDGSDIRRPYFLLDDVEVLVDSRPAHSASYDFTFDDFETLLDNDNLMIGNSNLSTAEVSLTDEGAGNQSVTFVQRANGDSNNNLYNWLVLNMSKRTDDYTISFDIKSNQPERMNLSSRLINSVRVPGATVLSNISVMNTGKIGTTTLAADTWYTVTAEISNSTSTGTLYLGDEQVSTFTLPALDQISEEDGLTMVIEPVLRYTAANDKDKEPLTFSIDNLKVTGSGEEPPSGTDQEAVDALKAAIDTAAGSEGSPTDTFTFAQNLVIGDNEEEEKAALASLIEQAAAKLDAANGVSLFDATSTAGVNVKAGITAYTAATAGTHDDQDGTAGSATATVTLTKGLASATTTVYAGITPTAYTPSSAKQLTALTVAGEPATLNEAEKTATVTLDYDIEVTEESFTATVSEYASYEVSGSGDSWTLTVTAEDGTTQEYTVTISRNENPDIAVVAGVKGAISTAFAAATMDGSSATTAADAKAVAEGILETVEPNGVTAEFDGDGEITTAAIDATKTDLDGTDGTYTATINLRLNDVTDSVTVTITIKPAVLQAITAVTVNVTEPSYGAAQEDATVDGAAAYTVVSTTWDPRHETFQYNQAYSVSVVLEPKAGYIFNMAGDDGDGTTYTWTDSFEALTEPTFTITKGAETNGTFTVSPEGPAAAGTEITVTATPAEHYVVDTMTYTGSGAAQDISFTGNTGTFNMPAENVTVNVTFKEVTPDAAEIAAITIEADPNDSALYHLVLVPEAGTAITRFTSAQFKFENESDSVIADLTAADGIVLTSEARADAVTYLAHPTVIDGEAAPITKAPGEKLELAQIRLSGIGSGTLKVSDAQGWTESGVNSMVQPLTLIPDAEGTAYTLAAAMQKLDINVDFRNKVELQNAQYTGMTLTVTSAGGTNLTIPLGTDAAASGTIGGAAVQAGAVEITNTGDAEKTGYRISVSLPADARYTVAITGEGYRRAARTVLLQEDQTIYFWNSVLTEGQTLPDGETVATAENKKNFVAGDIQMDNRIDIYDLNAVVSYYGLIDMDQDYNTYSSYIRYDLNRDGKIDARDVSMVLVSWGE